jgi:sortase A
VVGVLRPGGRLWRALLCTSTAVLVFGVADVIAAGPPAVASVKLAGPVELALPPEPPTTTTTAPPTTTTLPAPQPPPDPHASVPLVQVGTISIPSIGLSQPLYVGVSLSVIDNGPGHWPGTAMPGHVGNVVVAGHRVTHTRPFYNLDLVGPGAQLIFTTNEGTFVYDYVSTEIVRPTEVRIINQTAEPTATLFGCHPKGWATHRIVAHWRLSSARATNVA